MNEATFRNLRDHSISMSSLIPERCGPRCQEWLPSPDAGRCPQHQYLDDASACTVVAWLAGHDPSGTFATWMRTRTRSETDLNVQCKFQKRQQFFSDKGAQRWDSRQENVVPLFNRFLRYALDIDNGLGFVSHAVNVAHRQGKCRFLDIGFAPGGMSQLLLDADPRITGVGITLAPESGGNVYPDSLRNHPRYSVLEQDAVELALNGLPNDDPFDIVICGITISGSQNDESEHGQLKDRLHLAQLLLALCYVRPEGAILTRMHLGIRPLEIRMLALLTDIASSRSAYKPLTEFAMRKTFWMVFGTIQSDRIGQYLHLLRSALKSNTDLERADLIGLNLSEAMEKFGQHIVDDMRPVWLMQTKVLEWVMSGQQERLCGRCRRFTGRFCRACKQSVFLGVKQGAERVEHRLRSDATPLLEAAGAWCRAPTSAVASITRTPKRSRFFKEE